MKQQELSYGRVNDIVLQTLEPPRPTYYLVLLFLLGIVGIGASSWAYQILRGMGVAGINNPVGWGVYITDFVFWVGLPTLEHSSRRFFTSSGRAGEPPFTAAQRQ